MKKNKREMGLFNIFKKKQIPSSQQGTTVNIEINSPGEGDLDKSRQLLKQATSLKDTDINKAISLIEQAIKICPERILNDYFKLANYYHIAGYKDKAYTTLQQLLDNIDFNDIGMYNMDRSQVFDKFCTLSYKDKDYEQYIHFYCFWLYNITVAFACQGRKEELKNIIDNRDKLNYLAPTKINGSFKKIDKEPNKQEFNDKLLSYFDDHRQVLTEMANKAYEIDSSFESDELRINESIGQRSNRLLRKDDKFMTVYKSFNSDQFKKFIENNLIPIIKT